MTLDQLKNKLKEAATKLGLLKEKRQKVIEKKDRTASKIDKIRKSKQAKIDTINKYADFGKAIVDEAGRAGLPLALACALVEQESNFANVFGCDWGPQGGQPPYCGDPVSAERVQALLRSGKPNGVGLTQLTSFSYVEEAERLGGAHIPRNQLRVGFDLLATLIAQNSTRWGLGAYNGGPGNPQYAYADQVLAREAKWQTRLG